MVRINCKDCKKFKPYKNSKIYGRCTDLKQKVMFIDWCEEGEPKIE